MINLVTVTLENEMDLTLAYKRSIQVAERLGLTVATQTTFATAVSEISREIIDKTFEGRVIFGARTTSGRSFFCAHLLFSIDESFQFPNVGFEYARKLVPSFEMQREEKKYAILLQMAIPSTARIDTPKIMLLQEQLNKKGPINAYEEVKQKNVVLSHLNQEHELALLQANRLNEQKNEFLSVASHELNTPLTLLRSLAQLARRLDDGHSPTLSEHLVKLDAQSSKLVTLVQQLFDISRIESGQFVYEKEDIDLDAFLVDAVASARLMMPYHDFVTDLCSGCAVAIDRLRMEQVLNNIISNAAKYSEAGSRITISSFIKDNMAVIQVRDEGIGMSEEARRNVFQKYYRSQQVVGKYSGLGVGLYVASRIVSDHLGTIQVESEEGKGSTLSIHLSL